MNAIKIFLTVTIMFSALGAHGATASTHKVVFCQTKADDHQMANQMNAAVPAGSSKSAQLSDIIAANSCVKAVGKPGLPKYRIVDTDGDFVIIAHGQNAGFMPRRDDDQIYVVGN